MYDVNSKVLARRPGGGLICSRMLHVFSNFRLNALLGASSSGAATFGPAHIHRLTGCMEDRGAELGG